MSPSIERLNGKCLFISQLLRRAEFQSNRSASERKTTTNNWEPIAPHLVSLKDLSCADCSDEPKDKCFTKQWEDSFRSALNTEVEHTLRNPLPVTDNWFRVPEPTNKSSERDLRVVETHPPESRKPSTDALPSDLGQKCSKCHAVTIALYRRNGLLVCRSCR